eukprot:6464473-Amphidinium_carterae.1
MDDVSIVIQKLRAGSGLCFKCGSTERTSAECKKAKKGPPKGNSSDKGSRPNSQQREALRVDKGRMIRMRKRKVSWETLEVSHLANPPETMEREHRENKFQTQPGPFSAGVERDLSHGDALLDSGASHVILPMSELTPEGKKLAKPAKPQLAFGNAP